MQVTPSLPDSVAPFAGRITDIDSHEMVPAQLWVEEWGEITRPWAERAININPNGGAQNIISVPGFAGDVAEMDPKAVWTAKGPNAPGAADMNRRLDLMDTMGLSRQLMFPSGPGLGGLALYGSPNEAAKYGVGSFGVTDDTFYSYARKLMDSYNRWTVEVAAISPRFRPVAPIYGDTPEELISVTKKLIHGGIRAVLISAPRLPGGVSPASNDLDPFYAMLAEAKVAITLHIGGEDLFLRTNDWVKAKAFEGYKETTEVLLNPWKLSTYHLAAQNFVGTMVVGGVFDRHPTLRVGVTEFTAHWVGPLARSLDIWHEHDYSLKPKTFADGSEGRRLPMKPSEYINRNVRVSPFDFEPVGEYIDMYGLEDVYCFASDFPHVEGGKDPVGEFAASLEHLGPKILEKFFVTNGEFLLPD